MIEQASLVIGEGNWAVKSDSLLGYKINNGKYYPREMSVVRATTGTRINEDGLVEVVPYNLVNYSEQFDNAAWTKYQSTISANATTAPNGTLTADKLVENSTTDLHYVSSGVGAMTSTTSYSFSCYAKASERSFCWLYIYNGVEASGKNAWFNLANGSVGNVDAGITATIENVGDGWYRCTITRSITGNANAGAGFGASNSNGVLSYAGTTGSGIFAWGAQLVEGSSALDYLPTTDRLDVARIDYSSGSAALLVEPQRTNLILYSSSFNNAWWGNTNVSVTANDTISPSGLQDADKITLASGSSVKLVQSDLINQNGTYTQSVYVKAGTNNFIQLLVGADANPYCNFDILNGTYNATNSTATITSVGNGWFRCTMTYTTTTGAYVYLWAVDSLSSARASSTTSSGYYYAWGFQLEAGSYPTSLIPTQGSTVTRNADVISKTGIADLIGQTEGTLYIDTYIDNISAQTNDPVLIFLRGTSVETYIQVYDNGSARVVHYNGTTQCNIQSSSGLVTNGRHKFAFGYKNNDFVFYIDGVLIGTDTSGSVGAQNELSFQFYISSFYGMQNVNSTALWKTRLTNAELATLTTI